MGEDVSYVDWELPNQLARFCPIESWQKCGEICHTYKWPSKCEFGPWIPAFVSCLTTMMALMWNPPHILEIKIVMPDFKRTILFLFRNNSENRLIFNYVIEKFEINIV